MANGSKKTLRGEGGPPLAIVCLDETDWPWLVGTPAVAVPRGETTGARFGWRFCKMEGVSGKPFSKNRRSHARENPGDRTTPTTYQ